MTAIGWDFVQQDPSELIPRTMGELLAAFVRRRWPRHTAKAVERAWGVDPTTAANLVRGRASERTITKALKAEGWPLLVVLGQAVTGQTYEEFLESIVHEQERIRERAAERRDHVRRLEARAARLVALADRLDARESL
jgi:hypothetical protein